MEYIILISGIVTLIFASELLVRGAVGVAKKFNVSTLVIGMTIVSIGTSLPELLVSLKAALENHPEIAIGNVIGSNIANITIVLGLTTMILPITVKRDTLKVDWSIMMIVSVLFYIFALNGTINWWEGLIYFVGLIIFNIYQFKKSKKHQPIIENKTNQNKKASSLIKNLGLIAIGCVGLSYGTDWLLNGAVVIAKDFGVSEHIISVTILAFGTSLPELITSIMAALKKETDISVGNLIGSNIFNLIGVLGITSLFREIPVSNIVMHSDVFWMLGVAFLLFILIVSNYKINRVKGFILFVTYIAYIYFVVS